MTARCLVVAAILGTGLAGRPAQAESHQHDGIFLRFLVGPAGLTGTGKVVPERPDSYAYQGGGPGIVLAIGSALTRSIVFYGEATNVFAVGSTTETRGNGETGVHDRFESLGAGLSYYLPSNLYLGTSLFLGAGSAGGGGLGASATIGKEWWVSDRWGLGLAGRIYVVSDEVPGFENGSSIGGGAMIAFSASYN